MTDEDKLDKETLQAYSTFSRIGMQHADNCLNCKYCVYIPCRFHCKLIADKINVTVGSAATEVNSSCICDEYKYFD